MKFLKKKSEDDAVSKDAVSKHDYEALGKIVASIYETGYIDQGKSYKNSFVKGALGGIGGVLGATVGIALLLWFLSLFNSFPFVNKVINTIDQSPDTSQHE